ncbi:thioredoxin domain-containing protein, partial [Longibacter sp.]|uniref:thioredoxin domain-containing protein n=1 Tax=Longibacter sp. TaxID=2045415 RepID=UPI003EB95D8B
TCHWCHVMEEESFEDEEVAAVLNDTFVPIKVDREERPDVDNIYMSVCQMMSGRGGWPLNVLLTPDRRPFYATTYLPKRGRMKRMGVMELAERVGELWSDDRASLLADADKITDALKDASERTPDGSMPGTEALTRAFDTLSNRFDEVKGGFGSQPKFPSPHNLLFLLREYDRTGDERALDMVTKTLDSMRLGGIFDHVGFGFHRYSTDRHWLLPHFEKMLYDQAMLMLAYTEAYQVTGNARYAETATDIHRYLVRDMQAEEGGFFSAEDADSLTPEGEREEGAFYVWTTEKLREALDEDDAEWVIEVFQARDGGNYADESTGKKTGGNILHLTRSLEEVAEEESKDVKDLQRRWNRIRRRLLEVRSERPRPGLDDKILTDWNGLLIAALARAARVLPEGAPFRGSATDAASFLRQHMVQRGDDGSVQLRHRYRNGETAIRGHLDDYVFFGWGLIELYETTFDTGWLALAKELADAMLDRFEDDANGGFFFTADDAERLIVRPKEFYDGAMPSGNSAALSLLVRLSRMTGVTRYAEAVERLRAAAGEQVRSQPAGFTGFLVGLYEALAPSREVVIAGDLDEPGTQAMIEVVRRRYMPGTVLLHRPPGDHPAIADVAPFTEMQTVIEERPTAYVCHEFACQEPVQSAAELDRQLSG